MLAGILLLPLLSLLAAAFPLLERQSSTFWLEAIDHAGAPAFGEADYKVFRNVKDYGAKGDGTTDDTEAIKCVSFYHNDCPYAQRLTAKPSPTATAAVPPPVSPRPPPRPSFISLKGMHPFLSTDREC